MKISSNIVAQITVSKMNIANKKASTAMERLSSGLKINSAGDDPAGLAIANRLNVQVKALDQANSNAMNGISLIQTAEGALDEVHSMLNRMRELCVQGENGTLQDEDKAKIQEELDALSAEIQSIGENTQFNKKAILNLDAGKTLPIQIGISSGKVLGIEADKINISNITDELGTLSIENDTDILTKIDKAVAATSSVRAYLGAAQNRLEHTVSNLEVNQESTTASLSRIQDADMAEEMTNYTQYNVISQAGMAMLAQANQRPQQVLQLLN